MNNTLFIPVHGKLAGVGDIKYPKMGDVEKLYVNQLIVDTVEGPFTIDILAEDDFADELMQYNAGDYVSLLTRPYKVVREGLVLAMGLAIDEIDHNDKYMLDHMLPRYNELHMKILGCPELEE